MTWIALWKIVKGLPWGKILPVLGVVLLLVGNFVYIFSLQAQRDIARANEDKAIAELQVCEQNYARAQANTNAALAQIAATNIKIALIGTQKSQLDARLREAELKAARLAAAASELESIRADYEELRARMPEMNVCQTYEAVLIALAGG